VIKEYLSGLWRDRYVLFALVSSDLKTKYRGSALGVAWMIVTPLCLALILGVVFTTLFGADPKSFIPRLYAALNAWFFLSVSADAGTTAFVASEGYLKQTTVNAQVFPLRPCMVNFVNLLFSMIVFFVVYVFLQPQYYNAKMLMAVPGICIAFVFTASWSVLAAVIHLSFRDFQPFQSIVIQGLFYATPIIYDASMLAERGFGLLYQLNPFYYIIDIMVKPMMGVLLPSGRVYAVAVLMAVLLFWISAKAFMRVKKHLALKF
jgi:ABC-type polysaccharide/polyol phosphate export permease